MSSTIKKIVASDKLDADTAAEISTSDWDDKEKEEIAEILSEAKDKQQ